MKPLEIKICQFRYLCQNYCIHIFYKPEISREIMFLFHDIAYLQFMTQKNNYYVAIKNLIIHLIVFIIKWHYNSQRIRFVNKNNIIMYLILISCKMTKRLKIFTRLQSFNLFIFMRFEKWFYTRAINYQMNMLYIPVLTKFLILK